MKLEQKYASMLAGYDQLAGMLAPQAPNDPIKSPEKLEWAQQEGYQPKYDPNTDSVSWVQKPKAPYQQNHLMNLEASMSPERLNESYPAFAWKAKHADPVLEEIINKALSGDITTQRAKELVYQLALNSLKEAWSEGKPKGSAVASANAEQSAERTTATNKAAG